MIGRIHLEEWARPPGMFYAEEFSFDLIYIIILIIRTKNLSEIVVDRAVVIDDENAGAQWRIHNLY